MSFEDFDDGIDDFSADCHLFRVVVTGAFGRFDLEFQIDFVLFLDFFAFLLGFLVEAQLVARAQQIGDFFLGHEAIQQTIISFGPQ